MERVLDFIYGGPLGELAAKNVMPLMKIADVLQCPQLQNDLIDHTEQKGLTKAGTIEVLLKDACTLDSKLCKQQIKQISQKCCKLFPHPALIFFSMREPPTNHILQTRDYAFKLYLIFGISPVFFLLGEGVHLAM